MDTVEGRADAFFLGDPANVRYYTGFSGSSGFVVAGRGGCALFTDARYRLQAAREAPLARVTAYEGSVFRAMTAFCEEGGIGRVGYDPAHLTCAFLSAWRRESAGRVGLVPVKGRASRPRLRKEAGEVEELLRAVRISQQALLRLLDRDDLLSLRERDVAAELEAEMRRLGAEDRAFPTIALAGARSALPHGRSGPRPLKGGAVLLVDWGAGFRGYQADLTRTVWLKRPGGRLRRAYDAVLKSRERVLGAARPGVRAGELDRLARSVIEEAGFGAFIDHSLGHGVGLEVHEAPHLGLNSRERLEEGMVFTVEPGVYLPGVGGVRVEDVVLLGPDGPRLLSSLPAEMEYN